MRAFLGGAMVVSVACVTVATPRALLDEAPACTNFNDFERRAGEVLRSLPAGTSEPVQVQQARQVCARAMLEQLLDVREKRGPEAAQGVLDDLAMAFPPTVFSELVRDLAASDEALRGMASLAAATAASNRRQAQRDGTETKALESWRVEAPASPMTADLPVESQLKPCDVPEVRVALDCLADAVRRDVPTEVVAPRALAASGQAQREVEKLPPSKRVLALSRVAKVMGAIGVRDATLAASLRVACDAAWPEVDAAVGRGEMTRAAQLATPCGGVDGRQKAVEALRAAAVTSQLAEAQRAGTRGHSAALHRAVAATFGGPASSWPMPSGAWDLTRLQCARGLNGLPEVPGVQVRAVARCTRSRRASDSPSKASDGEKTFEAEQSLEWENIDGDVFVRCGAQVHTFRLAVRDLALGEAESVSSESPSALRHELTKLHRAAVEQCRTSLSRSTSCAGLNATEAPFEVEERFVEVALATRKWAPCFAEWFEARVGAPLPPLD